MRYRFLPLAFAFVAVAAQACTKSETQAEAEPRTGAEEAAGMGLADMKEKYIARRESEGPGGSRYFVARDGTYCQVTNSDHWRVFGEGMTYLCLWTKKK